MREVTFENCLYLQSVPGIEGPQGPPGKEGQRVSKYGSNWQILIDHAACASKQVYQEKKTHHIQQHSAVTVQN